MVNAVPRGSRFGQAIQSVEFEIVVIDRVGCRSGCRYPVSGEGGAAGKGKGRTGGAQLRYASNRVIHGAILRRR
jgi:hypothetical protein